MRLRFSKGKQAELINLAKKEKTWKELSTGLELVEGYIRNELRKEKTLLSEKAYKKLCEITGKNFDDYISEKKDDNWGKVKGGSLSSGKTKDISLPKESVELAEFYGIMLGDGNLTKVRSYKVGTYRAGIVGDSRYDYEYLVNYVKPLIENLFRINTRQFKYNNQNAMTIIANSKLLVNFLESKGFKAGDKIKNKTTIPNWIIKNKKFLKACLRGIYDTDGCVYRLSKQNVCQIQFTNHNSKLLHDVRSSLFSLGINPSKIVDGRRVYLTKKSELRKFLKHVGFRNPRHVNKIKTWNL